MYRGKETGLVLYREKFCHPFCCLVGEVIPECLKGSSLGTVQGVKGLSIFRGIRYKEILMITNMGKFVYGKESGLSYKKKFLHSSFPLPYGGANPSVLKGLLWGHCQE